MTVTDWTCWTGAFAAATDAYLLVVADLLVVVDFLFVVDAVGANDINTEFKYCCLYMCCLGKYYISSLNYFLSCGLVQDDGICCNMVGPRDCWITWSVSSESLVNMRSNTWLWWWAYISQLVVKLFNQVFIFSLLHFAHTVIFFITRAICHWCCCWLIAVICVSCMMM